MNRLVLFAWIVLLTMAPPSVYSGSRNEFVLGVGTHLSGGKRDIVRSLDLLQTAGVTGIRDDATWAVVERQKGQLVIPEHWDVLVDEARKRGIAVLWILDYGNRFYDEGAKPHTTEARAAFARYAAFVAKHFKGRVSRYEIWNEWEHSTGHTSPGSAVDYVELVRAAYAAIKQADPEAEVIVGAVGSQGIRKGYLKRLIELRVLDHADALSLHTYVHCRRGGSTPKAWAEWMTSLHADLDRWAGRSMGFYITEMGWPSHKGACGVSEQKQAEYLGEMLAYAQTMRFAKGIWWYDFQNDGPDPTEREHNFGLVDHRFRLKPAFVVLQGFLRPH